MTKCLFSTVLGQGIKYFIFLWQRLGVVVVISRHKSTGMEKRTACVCVLSLEGERGEGGASTQLSSKLQEEQVSLIGRNTVLNGSQKRLTTRDRRKPYRSTKTTKTIRKLRQDLRPPLPTRNLPLSTFVIFACLEVAFFIQRLVGSCLGKEEEEEEEKEEEGSHSNL